MKISGFTFVRNAVRLDFPVVECIRSVLPMVDEFLVAVGDSDDGTEALIRSIGDPKIVIIPSQWNPNIKHGGFVLAQQTNVALLNCTGHWAVYIQADEAIHEKHHAYLRSLMEKYRDHDRVESLSLHRTNFFGDYRTYTAAADDLCVRIVKPHCFVLSRGDAAGFTVHPKYKERGRRIRTVDTSVPFFHYMDLRPAAVNDQKVQVALDLWQGESNLTATKSDDERYYKALPKAFLSRFEGTHPAPMRERIARHGFVLDHASTKLRTTLSAGERKSRMREFLARHVGGPFRQGYRSSRLVGTEKLLPD